MIGRLYQTDDVRTAAPLAMADSPATFERKGFTETIVIAADSGNRPGSVHLAACSGGARPFSGWNGFIAALGLPQARVEA
jgi:hypothetical protein